LTELDRNRLFILNIGYFIVYFARSKNSENKTRNDGKEVNTDAPYKKTGQWRGEDRLRIAAFISLGAEGRINQIVNYNNKFQIYRCLYVSLSEFLNVPGRIIAYQSNISIYEKSFIQLYYPQN
jgi:hypothetical protein